VGIILVTSAYRPRYRSDFLTVLALPDGFSAQFTYSGKYVERRALERLREGLIDGVVVLAERADKTVRAIPIRSVRGVTIESETGDEPTFCLKFEVGPLLRLPNPRVLDAWSAWLCAAKTGGGVPLSTSEDPPLVGSFVQLLDADAPNLAPVVHASVADWRSLADRLLRTTSLSQSALMHIHELRKSSLPPLLEMEVPEEQPPLACRKDPFDSYELESATAYEMRVVSAIPSTASTTLRLRVTTSSAALSVSYPRYTVAGVHRDETVWIQAQRVQEQTVSSLTVEIADEAQSSKPSAAAGTGAVDASANSKPETLSFPRVSFGIRCAPSASVIGVSILGVIAGLLLANITPEVLGSKEKPEYVYGWLAKVAGYVLTLVSAYFGFRKTPG
jgi:hypothetical protein